MQIRPSLTADYVAVSRCDSVQDAQKEILDELLFIAAWEDGLIPGVGAYVRVRQFRRAHPDLQTMTLPSPPGKRVQATPIAPTMPAE